MTRALRGIVSFLLIFSCITPALLAGPQQAEEDFEVLRGIVRDGLYEFACEKATEFLRTHPASGRVAEAWLLLGIARFNTGRCKEALAALEKVRRSKKAAEFLQDILYWEGEAYLELSNHARALERFTKLLNTYPEAPRAADATYALGWAQAGTDKKREAISTFQILVENYPSYRHADLVIFKTGKWLYDLGDFEQAAKTLESFRVHNTQSTYAADAWYWAAESRFELRQWKEARGNYEKAITASKDNMLSAYAQYGLGWVLAEEGSIRKAADVLTALAEKNLPDELEASVYFKTAGVLFSAKEYQKAERYYLLLSDDETYGGRARFSRAECLYQTGAYKDAIRAFRSVSEITGEFNDDILNRIGWCYFKLDNPEKAVKKFRELIRTSSDRALIAEAHTRLGDIFFNRHRYEDAVNAYESALNGPPKDTEKEHALYWAGWSHYKLEQYDRAAATFRALLKQFENGRFSLQGRERLARSYFMLGKYEEAADAYTRLLRNEDTDEETRNTALYQIAECSFNAAHYERAAQQFDNVMRKLPGTALARQALYGKAMCWQSAGELDRANGVLKSFLARHAEDPLAVSASLLLADNLYKTSAFEEAAAVYKRIIAAYPESREAQESSYWLGSCFYQLGNMPRAGEIWRAAVKETPDSKYAGEMLLGSAKALWKHGEHEEARSLFEELIASDASPELKQRAHAHHGDMLQILMKYDEAVGQYTEALSGPNESVKAKALFGIAESQYHARDYKSALDSYAQVVYVHGRIGTIAVKSKFRMAKCLEKLKRLDEAASMYRSMIDEGGPDAEKARHLLDGMEKE